MERLTGRWPCGLSNYSEGKLPEVIDRLVRIEEILGDDYYMYRLKDLVVL